MYSSYLLWWSWERISLTDAWCQGCGDLGFQFQLLSDRVVTQFLRDLSSELDNFLWFLCDGGPQLGSLLSSMELLTPLGELCLHRRV